MLCIIENNCFSEEFLQDISLLTKLIVNSKEYNEVTVRDPSAFDSSAFLKLSKDDQDTIKGYFNSRVTSSNSYDGEIIKISADGNLEYYHKIFSPKEAVRYISEPLCVLVENSLNDGHFISCIIRTFGTERQKDALNSSQIRPANSGGCGGTINEIKSRILVFQGKSKFVRVYVIWDSDKNYPSEVNKKYDAAIQFLSRYFIKHHILHKREMENYMPDVAMQMIAGDVFSDWYNAYKTLSNEQKDFYNISDGFVYAKVKYDSANRMSLPAEISQLFQNVSDANFDHLKDGLKISDFKTEFPKNFINNPHVHKNSLNSRTQHQPDADELLHVTQEINSLL